MLIAISILALAYVIMGKDVKSLLKRIKIVDWNSNIRKLMDRLRPWALKTGRTAARPLLQFYYVMED
jgi:hypothetical protein